MVYEKSRFSSAIGFTENMHESFAIFFNLFFKLLSYRPLRPFLLVIAYPRDLSSRHRRAVHRNYTLCAITGKRFETHRRVLCVRQVLLFIVWSEDPMNSCYSSRRLLC